MSQRVYDVEEVMVRLGVSRETLYGMLRPYDCTAALKSIKIGKLRKITEGQLGEYLGRLEEEVKAA